MEKSILFSFLILAPFILWGCATTPGGGGGGTTTFSLSSTSITGGVIPLKCAHTSVGGQNKSPQLSWSNAPGGTKSFVVYMKDNNCLDFHHWLVFNIPSSTSSLTEGASGSISGATEFQNDFGKSGYGGPAPPEKHTYRITIYALSTTLEATSSWNEVINATSNSLGSAYIEATYTP